MDTQVLVDGLAFAEGPRWRNGRLYFSDVPADTVLSVDLAGNVETVAHIPGSPSGLGWLPDGTLLVARGNPAGIVAVRPDGSQADHADLSGLTDFPCNDMIVDAHGRAFVGACDVAGIRTGAPRPSPLLMVAPDGSARVVDDAMRFPNGPVITPDGSTLIVAETFGEGLAAFTLTDDGPADKRQWAHVPGSLPDGICLDEEGAVWFADALGNAARRVREGGEVVDEVKTENGCFACTLGGEDMRTLFLLTGFFGDPAKARDKRGGKIEMVRVDVAGTGSP